MGFAPAMPEQEQGLLLIYGLTALAVAIHISPDLLLVKHSSVISPSSPLINNDNKWAIASRPLHKPLFLLITPSLVRRVAN